MEKANIYMMMVHIMKEISIIIFMEKARNIIHIAAI